MKYREAIKILDAGHEITICKRDDWYYIEARPQEVGSIEGAGETIKVAWDRFIKMWDEEWDKYSAWEAAGDALADAASM